MGIKPNFNGRISRPQSLGGVFGGLLKIFGARASDADLAARWDEILGDDLSKIGKLVGVRKTKDKKINISIKPAFSAMSTELSYRVDEFRVCINKYFGYDAVGKIIIRK